MTEVTLTSLHAGHLFAETFSIIVPAMPGQNVGEEPLIYYKSVLLGRATIMAERTFQFHQIRNALSYLVCGKSAPTLAAQLKHQFPDIDINRETLFQHIIFKWEHRDIDQHNSLLLEYWKEIERDFAKDKIDRQWAA